MSNIRLEGLRPIRDRVIVRPEEAPKVTKGGIIIPEHIRGVKPKDEKGRHAVWGTVIAVGPGATDMKGRYYPIEVVPGDRIAFSEGAPKEVFKDDSGADIYSISGFAIFLVDEDTPVRRDMRGTHI
jgi:chaperonin GroES